MHFVEYSMTLIRTDILLPFPIHPFTLVSVLAVFPLNTPSEF